MTFIRCYKIYIFISHLQRYRDDKQILNKIMMKISQKILSSDKEKLKTMPYTTKIEQNNDENIKKKKL